MRVSATPLALLWAFAVAAGSIGAADEELSYEALIEGATAARERGDLEKSLDLLRRAYAVEPTPGLRHNIARLLEDLGLYREAIDEYGATIAHPLADRALRQRDEEAIARLTPRLSKAWLRFRASTSGGKILLDGAPIAPGGEVAAGPGPHVIEADVPGTRELDLSRISAPAGKRTDLHLELDRDARGKAKILLAGVPRSISRVAIDGYSLRANPADVDAVRVGPGAHRIVVELSDRPGIDTQVTLAAGETFAVHEWIGTEPADRSRSYLGPIVASSSGLLLAAGGVALLMAARSGRAEIENAARDERGYITGLTLAEADRIESRSADQATTGVIFLGSGIVAIAAGAAWWYLIAAEDPSEGP